MHTSKGVHRVMHKGCLCIQTNIQLIACFQCVLGKYLQTRNLSTSHSFLPSFLSMLNLFLLPLSVSQQELKVACALASAHYTLFPTRSCSVNGMTWLSVYCFYSANSVWRNKCVYYLDTWRNGTETEIV